MKVVFETSCVTIFAKYVKGRTYDLNEAEAKQFIKEGLAKLVEEKKKPAPKRKTTTRKRN